MSKTIFIGIPCMWCKYRRCEGYGIICMGCSQNRLMPCILCKRSDYEYKCRSGKPTICTECCTEMSKWLCKIFVNISSDSIDNYLKKTFFIKKMFSGNCGGKDDKWLGFYCGNDTWIIPHIDQIDLSKIFCTLDRETSITEILKDHGICLDSNVQMVLPVNAKSAKF